MDSAYIYRCTKNCPQGKRCFVIKLPRPLTMPLPVLLKCPVQKKDIRIMIGEHPP